VHFDVERDWRGGELSLEQCALHELGHALGLDHTEDERAAMYPVPSVTRARLAASDLAGIHSLYGGGADSVADLCITAEGAQTPVAILRGVAPPAATTWFTFDTDGDGADEVLVARIDKLGHGWVTAYHFDAQAHLERTVGPLYGIASPGARILGRVNELGERVLEVRASSGEVTTRLFETGGRVGAARAGDRGLHFPEPSSSGRADLTGDGVPELIERASRR
jgi:hypothetical protein